MLGPLSQVWRSRCVRREVWCWAFMSGTQRETHCVSLLGYLVSGLEGSIASRWESTILPKLVRPRALTA